MSGQWLGFQATCPPLGWHIWRCDKAKFLLCILKIDCLQLFLRLSTAVLLRQDQQEQLKTLERKSSSRLRITASVCSVNAKAPGMSIVKTALEFSKLYFTSESYSNALITESITYKSVFLFLLFSTRFLWWRKWWPWGRYEQVSGLTVIYVKAHNCCLDYLLSCSKKISQTWSKPRERKCVTRLQWSLVTHVPSVPQSQGCARKQELQPHGNVN